MLEILLILFFPFFMAFAAASDLVSMTISNKVSLALMAGFMVFAFWMKMDYATIGWHWVMFAVVLSGGFSLFAFGIIGGGDAKLAAATALWLGWEHTMSYFIIAAFMGGALTLILLRLRTMPLPERISKVGWIAKLYRADNGVPYGIALGFSALVVYPQTPWMQHVFEAARL